MFNVSHSQKISGKVKTLSRKIMHSLNIVDGRMVLSLGHCGFGVAL